MKIKALAISAISVALLASCSGGSGKGALNSKSTPTDSLSYTLGEMAAMQRAISFEQDTTLRGDAAHKAFDRGFNDGFKLLHQDDEAYNSGLLLGLQLAMQMNDLNNNQGIALSRDLVLAGYNTNTTDSVDPGRFQQIQERGGRLISTIVSSKVMGKVDDLAKKGKYQQKEGVYYIVNNAGNGATLSQGQKAMVRLNIMDKDRKELIPQLKEQPTEYEVGAGFIPVLDKVLPMMNQGAAYEVVATPQQVFGPQVPPMVDQKEPVIITIEVVSLDVPADTTAAAQPEVRTAPTPQAVKAGE